MTLLPEEDGRRRFSRSVFALGDVMGDIRDDDAGEAGHRSVLRADRRRVN
jgi:hypothetical protein